jgi:microcompartment protein CcmK/EutM
VRIARVIGKVTMNRKMAEVLPGSYLLVRPIDRKALGGAAESSEETLVLFDNLAAREGDRVGLVEGREASVPFLPDKVPYDSYNACILDTIDFEPVVGAPSKATQKYSKRPGK